MSRTNTHKAVPSWFSHGHPRDQIKPNVDEHRGFRTGPATPRQGKAVKMMDGGRRALFSV